MGCLYRIDFDNGKSYVGFTNKTAEVRLREHEHAAIAGDTNSIVHKALKKYAGKYRILTLVIAKGKKYLSFLEKRAIKVYNTKVPHGYNMTDGGDGGSTRLGQKNSKEHRRKISEATKGKIVKASTREIWAAQRKGKQSGENNPFFGKTHTEDSVKKILANRCPSSEYKYKEKLCVICGDKFTPRSGMSKRCSSCGIGRMYG